MIIKDLLLVLVGGICSAFGGLFAVWYQAKKVGKIKFEETIGERKVAAYGKGLELVGELQSILIQGIEEDGLKFLYEHGDWFADNLILLPHTFVENWRSIRLNLKSAIRQRKVLDGMQDGEKRDEMINRLGDLDGFCDTLAQEAEEAIRKELNLPECKIKRPPKNSISSKNSG